MAVTGLIVDESGFEVLAEGVRVGSRRLIGSGDVEFLNGLAARYARATRAVPGSGVLPRLGRELFGWLDGGEGQLSALLERAGAPLVFEVTGPRSPSKVAWAVLRAPWELMARPEGGFLAEDELARFCVVRRLGPGGEQKALDGFRLGVAFMASAPRDQPELDFEAEEAAVLAAVGQSRVDLVVDDSGDPVQLGHRLAELGGMPAVHLSCHGHNSWRVRDGEPRVPVLMMEDDTGANRATTAGDLVRLFTVRPRLLFVSACLTATGTGETDGLPLGDDRTDNANVGGRLAAQSMATALVTAGVPAVIGWDGSVRDRAATVFAARLYAALADRADLAEAVDDARRALLESGDKGVSGDWHLARLWLGPGGGGPLVAGTRKRSLIPATHGTQMFLAGKPQVPVASAEMFVGRRPQLQRSLRALRSGERAGVLLRGQGRQGKSSLAARIADRCPGYAVAVVFGDYTALGILDAVADAVRTSPAARDLIKDRLPAVRERPEAVETVLTDLLAGPCAQGGPDGGRPLLLVIDDLEQVLTAEPGGPHRVAAAVAPVLAGVLRAFDPAVTDSRLVVTSRFAFTLAGLQSRLEDVQLPPLSPVAQAKLLRRQQSITPQDLQDERAALAGRAVTVSRGNPGLQDLIGLRLVYGDQVPVERAEAAVAEMEDYLRQGLLPAEPEVRAFLENLALDALLAEAGPASTALLRAATLFTLPVPEPVIAALAEAVGGSPGRLRGLGLLDPYPDLADPAQTALAASPLAAGRLDPLTSQEQAALAAVSTGPLFTAWGGTAAQPSWDAELDLQLTRLALLADDPDVTGASAAIAVAALREGPAASAFGLGRDAIALLDRHGRRVPLLLLRQAADAALTSGDGPAGEALLARAAQQAETGNEETSPIDKARIMVEQARRLIIRGEHQEAEELLRRACQLFTDSGSEEDAASAMGTIGDIAYMRGDFDQALRIRREVQLPAYERLGDTRSAAATWSSIAQIAYMRGDYDEALRIRREVQLPAYERLGYTREIATTWGGIADIAYMCGDYDEALRIRREVQLPAFERLGDIREAAMTWGGIADIACQRGDYDEALRIRREVQLPAFERLGDTLHTARTCGSIAEIAYLRWDYDEAAELHGKSLEVYRELGDLDGIAGANWGLAMIDVVRHHYAAALPRLIESFQINSQLQRPDGIALVGNFLGQLLLHAGQATQARQVLGDALAAAELLGWTGIARRISELLQSRPPDEDT